MLKFFKTWTLPISMLAGAIGYFVFANVTFLEPTKPFMYTLIAYLTPFLIFAQLLLTFCKISVRELMPSPWHGWLLLIQAVSSLVITNNSGASVTGSVKIRTTKALGVDA